MAEGRSQAFTEMQLPPGQLVRVPPSGTAYTADTAPLQRSLCLNCHAVSHTSFAVENWYESAHARAGVLCGACHGAHEAGFMARPSPARCRTCHASEYDQFMASAHGPSRGPGMTCASCHEIHATDRKRARDVATCSGCHLGSEHVQGYPRSRMGLIFLREGRAADGTLRAPDCVHCHMPPDSLMLTTGDFRNDHVTLHNPALTVKKDPRRPGHLSADAVAFLLPICTRCHSETNATYRLENADQFILAWTPIGMTADVRQGPVPAPGGQRP